MTIRHFMPWTLLVLLFVGVCSVGVRQPRVHAQEGWTGALAIVVGRDFGEHDISLALLRRAFRGDATDFGGARLIPFNFAPETPARRLIDRSILGMQPDQVASYWIDRRIRGEGLPPRTVPSPSIMKALVSKVPGAIGYIPAELVDDRVHALTVDGKHFRAPDYPVRAH